MREQQLFSLTDNVRCREAAPGGATMKLPPALAPNPKRREERTGPAPDMESIHRALFANKRSKESKGPTFTITMPKKSKEEEGRRW